MIVLQHLFKGRADLSIDQNRNAAQIETACLGRGYMNTVRPKLLLRSRIQGVEIAGRDGIKPRGGLSRKTISGSARGPRKAGPLAHPPDSWDGYFSPVPRKPDDAILKAAISSSDAAAWVVFLQRTSIFCATSGS